MNIALHGISWYATDFTTFARAICHNTAYNKYFTFLKVDLELPTDWHVPILCIIFPLENPHYREKRYVE